jgi:hypothetical protein
MWDDNAPCMPEGLSQEPEDCDGDGGFVLERLAAIVQERGQPS